MNWVRDREQDAYQSGFYRGYLEARTKATTLLEHENLLVLAKWLDDCYTELQPETPNYMASVYSWAGDFKIEKHLDKLPDLQRSLTEANDAEKAVVDADAERLKRAAPDLLATLRLLHAFLEHGSGGLLKKTGRDMTLSELTALARESIAKAENV